jgi:hypothetical protein
MSDLRALAGTAIDSARLLRAAQDASMILELSILGALLLALLVVLPIWPYSRDWGYWPVAIVAIVLVTLLVMTLAAMVPR